MNPYGMMLSAGDQLREASDRLKRLQATAAGPPGLKDTVTVRLCVLTCRVLRQAIHAGTGQAASHGNPCVCVHSLLCLVWHNNASMVTL